MENAARHTDASVGGRIFARKTSIFGREMENSASSFGSSQQLSLSAVEMRNVGVDDGFRERCDMGLDVANDVVPELGVSFFDRPSKFWDGIMHFMGMSECRCCGFFCGISVCDMLYRQI